jgi:epoxyqueuosine reductase
LCLDACPTQAFPAPYVLDARRCISYLTIELRGAIPEDLRAHMGRAVFGCDICQDVCPWNRKAPITMAKEFTPRELAGDRNSKHQRRKSEDSLAGQGNASDEIQFSMFLPELESLASLSQRDFSEVFRRSAVKRAKWRGLVRNACVALGNRRLSRDAPARPRAMALLERLASSDDALIAEHASWALERLSAAD